METVLRKLMKNATKEPRIPTARKMAVAKTVPMLVVETLFWIMEKSVITALQTLTRNLIPVAPPVNFQHVETALSILMKHVMTAIEKMAMVVVAHV